jgi:hypothetical protein
MSEQSAAEELLVAAAERGWELEQGPENKAAPWRRIWIARRHGHNLYGDPASILKRIAEPRTKAHHYVSAERVAAPRARSAASSSRALP